MGVEQILQNEIKGSKIWYDREKEKSTYKRDLKKRIELMIWVLESMKNDGTDICQIKESRMDEIIEKIKQTNNIFEMDPLSSELRILNWICTKFVVTKLRVQSSHRRPVTCKSSSWKKSSDETVK